MHGAYGRRMHRARERHRQQAERKQDADKEEMHGIAQRRDIEQELARARAEIAHQHVDGEHASAQFARRSLVQPAFDDHVHAHHAQAGKHAQRQPHPRVHERALHQDARAIDRGEHGKGADMPDALQDARTDPSAHHEADIKAGHDDTDQGIRCSGDTQAQGQEGAEVATAQHEGQDGKKQGEQGKQGLAHRHRVSNPAAAPKRAD